MKTCTKCKAEKPKEEFSKDSHKKDGLRSSCKLCAAATTLSWRERNRVEHRQYSKAWAAINPGKSAIISKKWREDNPDRVVELSRSHYSKNAEKYIARARAWYLENTERATRRLRAYYLANKEKYSALGRNRRARERNANGTHTAADVKAIFESQRGMCASCPKKLIKSGKNRYHVDHIQPLARGGSNDKYNLQCLCPGCNLRKHAKDPLDWAWENGRLL